MPIDTSIYQLSRPVQQTEQQPGILDTMHKAYSVAGMANQMRTQQGMQDAYAKNTDPNTGQLNQGGFISDLGRVNPQAAIQMQNTLAESQKLQAEAQTAKLKSADAILDVALPRMQYLAGMSPDDRAKAFNKVMQDNKADGVPMQNVPQTQDGQFIHDEDWFNRRFGEMKQSKAYLAQQLQRVDIGKGQAETEAKLAEAAKTRNDTVKQNPDIAGKIDDPSTDPATLIPRYVPKEHQTKALEAVKNAQDINALTPKIMAAFEKGSSRNPIEAAQGQREFEGLINTTVKDTEGTARQAAFDSIHKTMTPSGLTASPGENETKARTVQEYLQSKAASPFTKGYGVDLSKYSSTAPYKGGGPQREGSGSGVPGVASAKADEKPTTASEDSAAVAWAKNNLKNPKAREILKYHGML